MEGTRRPGGIALPLAGMAAGARFLPVDKIQIEEKAGKKHLKPEIAPALRDLCDALAGIPEGDWTVERIENTFEAVRGRHGNLSRGKLAQPVRVSITGRAIAPGIFETLAVLGRRKSVERIDAALESWFE